MRTLNKISDKKNPFKVPENYFEDVNKKIISVTTGDIKVGKKISIYDRFRPYFLVAASVTGFLLISYSTLKLISHYRMNSQLSGVLSGEYSDSFLNEIDILTIEENASSFILSEELPEVSNTDIIDYLLLENIEINDIYEQI
jgi:hypothetical protein